MIKRKNRTQAKAIHKTTREVAEEKEERNSVDKEYYKKQSIQQERESGETISIQRTTNLIRECRILGKVRKIRENSGKTKQETRKEETARKIWMPGRGNL